MTISVLDRNRAADKTEVEPQAPLGALHDAAAGVDEELLPCRVNDAELWFAESPADVEHAKALCIDCPVQALCLDGALERREPWGVWGGELFLQGVVIPRKRPRGRPRKSDQTVQVALAGQHHHGTAAQASPQPPSPLRKHRKYTSMKTYRNGSNDMNLMHEELARAQMTARLGEAHELRRGHQLALARRMSRKAEQAAQQARLALARAI